MRRRIGSLVCGLVVLTLVIGCSSGNDEPDTAASDTSAADGSTTTTAEGGPFDAATTTTGSATTDTTAAGDGENTSPPTGTGSADATSPVPADTPQDLGAAIGDDCANYADTAGNQQQPGTTGEGTCEFGGEIINLYTFADAAAQREFVDNGAFFDCSFIVAFGGGGSTFYVAGDGWIARPGTEAVAADLAAALDGEVATYACEAS